MEPNNARALRMLVDQLTGQLDEAMDKLREATKLLSETVKERDSLYEANKELVEENTDLVNEIRMWKALKPKETHDTRPKWQRFLEDTPPFDDEEVNDLYMFMEKIFDGINDKTNGDFYEEYDWFVTRDKDGKVHLHLFGR